jgi:two-component system sensor histidine kinase/response regulator
LKNTEIQLKLQPGLQIFFDADIMKSMLRNLLINAVKFSHEDSLIKLNLYRNEDDAVVEFIDTGVGMSLDAQRQLKDQIMEEGKITPMREKGKGLGLWVVYHFIQRNGGTFFFESEEHVGSRFGFRVPLQLTTSNQ